MTIYALSTGPGVSGVAIVRISGPEASHVIKLLTKKEIPSPRVATLRKINNINSLYSTLTGDCSLLRNIMILES